MKILVSSDWHLDAVTAGVRRFDDLRAAVQETIDAAVRERVDLYLCLGDICDPDAPYVHEGVGYLVQVASVLNQRDIPSRWLTGNHDVVEDGTGASTLSALKGWERGVNPHGLLNELDGLHVYDQPGIEVGGIWGRDVALIALPFVPRSHSYSPRVAVQAAAKDLEAQGSNPKHVIVAGHLNIEGITPGSETHEMSRGREMYFPIDTVRECFGDRALMLNGHYHERQTFRGVRIPGSLERLTFGEKGTPGYLIVELD